MDNTNETNTILIGEYKQALETLEDWMEWINTYYCLIGETGNIVHIVDKTTSILARGNRKHD